MLLYYVNNNAPVRVGLVLTTQSAVDGKTVPPTTALDLAAPFTGPTSFRLCRDHLDEVVLVPDERILAAQALGLTLHDHLVIGKSAEFSFKSAGYL